MDQYELGSADQYLPLHPKSPSFARRGFYKSIIVRDLLGLQACTFWFGHVDHRISSSKTTRIASTLVEKCKDGKILEILRTEFSPEKVGFITVGTLVVIDANHRMGQSRQGRGL